MDIVKTNSKKTTKKRIMISLISVLCAFATIFGIISAALSMRSKDRSSEPGEFDSIYTDGTQKVEFRGAEYSVDEKGNIWEETNEAIRLVCAGENAKLLAVFENTLFTLTQDKSGKYLLSEINVTTGKLKHSRDLGKDEISSFSMTHDGVYYMSGSKIFLLEENENTETVDVSLLPDISADSSCSDHDTESAQPSNSEFFTVYDDDNLVLYAENPSYIDESQVEFSGEGDNNKYISYLYSLSDRTVSAYDNTYGQDVSATSLTTTSSIQINGVSVPFSDYSPYASYFTKNGKSCTTCHNDNSFRCTDSPPACNCIRYWPSTSNYKVDLAAVQCYAFARFCQWRIYGYHDYNGSKFTNALGGTWKANTFTASDLMDVFLEYGAGGHIRTIAGHSLFVISVNASGFTTYECNTTSKDCKVYTRDWTWATFYNYSVSRGLYFYMMPKEFVGSGSLDATYPTGDYLVDATSGLNLRAQPTTSSSVLALIPNGTILTITETTKIDGATSNIWWGKTTYNGKTGWISLDYAKLQSQITGIKISSLPDRTVFYKNEDFSYDGLEVQLIYSTGTNATLPAGYTVSAPDMSKTGTFKIRVSYLTFSATYEITIKEHIIMPSDIVFDRSTITIMTGGEFIPAYGVDYTVLPENANNKTVEWSVISGEHLVSVNKTTGVITATAASSNFIEGYATIRATSLAEDENGKKSTVYNDYYVEVVKASDDGEWSQAASNLPDEVIPADYIIEYCASETDFNNGNWKPYTSSVGATAYKYRFRNAYKLTWYYDLGSNDGSIILPSSFGYPSSVGIGDTIPLSRYKTITQTNRIFAGWFTSAEGAKNLDTSLAYKGAEINSDTSLYAGWIYLDSENYLINAAENDPVHEDGKNLGAFGVFASDINISDSNGGLRFYGHISTPLAEKLSSLSSKDISYGMIVQLAKNTSDNLTSATANGYVSDGHSIVVTSKKNYGEYKFLSGNSYTVFTTLVTNIPIESSDEDIAARAFITYYDANGNKRTFYFTNTEENTPDMDLKGGGITSNLYEVAASIYASASETEKNWLIENILGHAYKPEA